LTEAGNKEELHYLGAVHRIYRLTVGLTLAGTMAATWSGGPGWGIGFLLGAGLSLVNFRWLHRLVDSIGPNPRSRPGGLTKFFLVSRYALLGVAGYVIVKYFKVNIMAALIGLFAAVAAVLIEILYELIYVRT